LSIFAKEKIMPADPGPLANYIDDPVVTVTEDPANQQITLVVNAQPPGAPASARHTVEQPVTVTKDTKIRINHEKATLADLINLGLKRDEFISARKRAGKCTVFLCRYLPQPPAVTEKELDAIDAE
jgi:hypothetical protein